MSHNEQRPTAHTAGLQVAQVQPRPRTAIVPQSPLSGNLLFTFYHTPELYGEPISSLNFRFDMNFYTTRPCPFCGNLHYDGFTGNYNGIQRMGVLVCRRCGRIHDGY